ncbi:flavodoxin domain-containing protein [Rhodonellum sp.]|uniref:flavodoxin domain-containing protein n=1 Tax=Rhodonellum sp. TaxID=2231180 RepID=UPI00271726B8|nr:flavodoxin domain-containing protein [Rhodonellum sp.]MDO9554151.1 flavodoxin domain-containing protein [Rhodonellum sp.]
MKTLLIFGSKTGGTTKIVKTIQKKIGMENCDLVDLNDNPKPSLEKYNIIVIGGPIYAGKLLASVQKYISENSRELLTKPLALFTCGMNEPNYQSQLENAFPENLKSHSFYRGTLGGEYDFEKLNWFERFMVKSISGTKTSMQHYKMEEIDRLVNQISEIEKSHKNIENT